MLWGAYGVVALALAAEVMLLRSRTRRACEAARRTADWSNKEREQ